MKRVELADQWRIIHDIGDNGGGIGLGAAWPQQLPTHGWHPAVVPAPWQRELGETASGVVWYRRPLGDVVKAGERAWLRFDAVATECRAWIAGRSIGEHTGDFVPFEFEVTNDLAGELVVRVTDANGVHSGIWSPVSVRHTGTLAMIPGGAHIAADANLGRVHVRVELHPHDDEGELIIELEGQTAKAPIARGARSAEAIIELDFWKVWSPHGPNLYSIDVNVMARGTLSDSEKVRFGFRSLEASRDGSLRLNREPLLVRGVVYGGHEPAHLAPAPTPREVRERFAHLRAAGFNAVTVDGFYPPDHFYQIADETGMILWQVHPDASTDPERTLELIRRERNHPSVAIVSAAPSEAFSQAAADNLHGVLLLPIGDNAAEHAPVILGGVLEAASWPDARSMFESAAGRAEFAAIDRWMEDRYDADTLERFRRESLRFAYEQRRSQAEILRANPAVAGFTIADLRDTRTTRTGLMDEQGRWRYDPADMKRWLADTVLLLGRPGHRSAFVDRSTVDLDLTVSNFSENPIDADLTGLLSGAVWAGGSRGLKAKASVPRGNIIAFRQSVTIPEVQGPTEISLTASVKDTTRNRWSLWAFPVWAGDVPAGAVRLAESGDAAPSTSVDVAALVPKAAPWRFDEPMPDGTRLVLTSRLTRGLVEFMLGGGRVVLFAGPGAGSLASTAINLARTSPFVAEAGPFVAGDSDWIVDLLHRDLMDASPHAIPTGDRGLDGRVDPIVRLMVQDDAGEPHIFDAVMSVRVGEGLLAVTTLDHTGPAGRHLLARLLEFAVGELISVRGELGRDDLLSSL